MITFQIPDMRCSHCVAAITRALQALDAQAQLAFDLAQQRLIVQQASAPAAALAAAIADAGYTPVELAPAATAAQAPAGS